MRTFFFRDLDQDDVISDLAHTAPWNDELTFPAPETAESARTRHDQSRDLPTSFIKFKIDRTAKTPAGAGIYDLFLF